MYSLPPEQVVPVGHTSVSGTPPLSAYSQASGHNPPKRRHDHQLPLSSSVQRNVTEGQKKRKLDLVKCERCRLDKQKCTPTDRVWPTKCDRCITKDFPCSEGKRVHRTSKHALPEQTPLHSGCERLVQSDRMLPDRLQVPSTKEGLRELSKIDISDFKFLSGYHTVLSTVVSRLRNIEKQTMQHFRSRRICWIKPYEKLLIDANGLGKAISSIIKNSTNLWVSTSSPNELGSALLDQASIQSSLFTVSTRVDPCHLCNQYYSPKNRYWSDIEDLVNRFKQTGAVCQEVITRQAQISSLIMCPQRYHPDELEDIAARIHSLGLSITAMATRIMSNLEDTNAAELNETFFSSPSSKETTSFAQDFIGRTVLHQILDENPLPSDDDSYFCNEIFINPQSAQINDRLGRTLLHLFCQRGLIEGVELALKSGADPSTTTIFGHTPLHYAAAGGYLGVCKLLLKHKEKFDIAQTDESDNSAPDYAELHGHDEVAYFIDMALEEQRSAKRIATETGKSMNIYHVTDTTASGTSDPATTYGFEEPVRTTALSLLPHPSTFASEWMYNPPE